MGPEHLPPLPEGRLLLSRSGTGRHAPAPPKSPRFGRVYSRLGRRYARVLGSRAETFGGGTRLWSLGSPRKGEAATPPPALSRLAAGSQQRALLHEDARARARGKPRPPCRGGQRSRRRSSMSARTEPLVGWWAAWTCLSPCQQWVGAGATATSPQMPRASSGRRSRPAPASKESSGPLSSAASPVGLMLPGRLRGATRSPIARISLGWSVLGCWPPRHEAPSTSSRLPGPLLRPPARSANNQTESGRRNPWRFFPAGSGQQFSRPGPSRCRLLREVRHDGFDPRDSATAARWERPPPVH